MKSSKSTLAATLFALFFLFSATMAKATTTTDGGGECDRCKQYCQSLIDVDITLIEINGPVLVVDVGDVLSDNEIEILNVEIEKNTIASYNRNFLNNWFKNADILSDNDLLVGVQVNALTKKIEKIYKHKKY
jgi:hypothetical protein